MARFARFIAAEHNLQERVVPVGMSCGGLKPDCDHHPHGIEDKSEVLKFILNH